eukprot:g8018.t1
MRRPPPPVLLLALLVHLRTCLASAVNDAPARCPLYVCQQLADKDINDPAEFPVSQCDGGAWKETKPQNVRGNPVIKTCTLTCKDPKQGNPGSWNLTNTRIALEDAACDNKQCTLYELHFIAGGEFKLVSLPATPTALLRASAVRVTQGQGDTAAAATGCNVTLSGVINVTGLGWVLGPGYDLLETDDDCDQHPRMAGSFGGTGGGFFEATHGGSSAQSAVCSNGDAVRVRTYCNDTEALLRTGLCEDTLPPFGSGAGGTCTKTPPLPAPIQGGGAAPSYWRGGGVIQVTAAAEADIYGVPHSGEPVLVADGAAVFNCDTAVTSSRWCGGGSGGSVVIKAPLIKVHRSQLKGAFASPIATANGGNTTVGVLATTADKCVGAGAGGGGRIVVQCENMSVPKVGAFSCGGPLATRYFLNEAYQFVQSRGGSIETQVAVSGGLLSDPGGSTGKWLYNINAFKPWALTPLDQSTLGSDPSSCAMLLMGQDASTPASKARFSPPVYVTADTLAMQAMQLGMGSVLVGSPSKHNLNLLASGVMRIQGQLGCCAPSSNNDWKAHHQYLAQENMNATAGTMVFEGMFPQDPGDEDDVSVFRAAVLSTTNANLTSGHDLNASF